MLQKSVRTLETITIILGLIFTIYLTATLLASIVMLFEPRNASTDIQKYMYCKSIDFLTIFDSRKEDLQDIKSGIKRKEENEGFQNLEEQARIYHDLEVLEGDIAMWNERSSFCQQK